MKNKTIFTICAFSCHCFLMNSIADETHPDLQGIYINRRVLDYSYQDYYGFPAYHWIKNSTAMVLSLDARDLLFKYQETTNGYDIYDLEEGYYSVYYQQQSTTECTTSILPPYSWHETVVLTAYSMDPPNQPYSGSQGGSLQIKIPVDRNSSATLVDIVPTYQTTMTTLPCYGGQIRSETPANWWVDKYTEVKLNVRNTANNNILLTEIKPNKHNVSYRFGCQLAPPRRRMCAAHEQAYPVVILLSVNQANKPIVKPETTEITVNPFMDPVEVNLTTSTKKGAKGKVSIRSKNNTVPVLYGESRYSIPIENEKTSVSITLTDEAKSKLANGEDLLSDMLITARNQLGEIFTTRTTVVIRNEE